jgi:hypothetical protein
VERRWTKEMILAHLENAPDPDWKDVCMRILSGIKHREGIWYEDEWARSKTELLIVHQAFLKWCQAQPSTLWCEDEIKKTIDSMAEDIAINGDPGVRE